MKSAVFTLLLLLAVLFVNAQNNNARQQQPAPVQLQERKELRAPKENIRQVKKERHTDKCCVRKSEANPRKKE